MTVVNPKSISGITSITTASGSDNLFTVHTNDTTERFRIDSTGKASFGGEVSIGGTLTYEDVTNVDAVGIITARSDVSIADKIIHTGDTDTAIRFPTADTFTVETGGSESFRVDSSQRLLLGHTSSQTIGSNSHGRSQINVTANQPVLTLARFENVAAGPSLVLGKSRSGTAGNYTVVQDDDSLGNISFAGADGTDLITVGAIIEAKVDNTPGSNDMPTRLVFSTTKDGASTPTERLRIASDGKLFTTRTHGSTNTGDHPALDIDTYSHDGSPQAAMSTGIDFSVEGVHKKRLAVTYADSSAGTGDWIFYRDQGNNKALQIDSSGNTSIVAGSLGLGDPTNNVGMQTKVVGPGFLGPGSNVTLAIATSYAGGRGIVHAYKTSDVSKQTTYITDFQARGTGNGYRVNDRTIVQNGGVNYSVSDATKGFKITNNESFTITYSMMIEVVGNISY